MAERIIIEDAELTADQIIPLHDVRDMAKLASLTETMSAAGWLGRPLLVMAYGAHYQALTGTHRLAAAVAVGLNVPVVISECDSEQDYAAIHDAYSDDDRLAVLRQIGASKDAIDLMQSEIAHTN